MDVFFLFPGRVWIVFSVTGIPTDKEPYRAKVLVSFGTFRRDTQFWFRVSILFLKCFSGAKSIRRFAVCVEKSVPVASAQWHVQVWVKVSVR